MKLTKRSLDSFKYEGANNSRDVRWDDLLPGFGVRIYPSGKKAFVLSYRVSGRKRMFTIGRYGVYTLQQAQDEAKDYLRAIAKGNDPLEAKQRASQGETIKDLCEAYMERHAIPRKKSWKDDRARINKYIIPAWGSRKVASIKRSDMAAMHSKMGKSGHPYGANRTLRLVGKMFRLATQWGFIPDDYPNPSRDIELFKEHKRDRWVSEEELPRLMKAVDKEENIYARNAIWLFLLTGLRRSELLTAQWDYVDWTRKELRLPETKAGRVHYLPLSDPAMALLRKIPRIKDNPYILPGQKEGSHLVNIQKPWNRIKKDADVEGVRLHDLRRTVGSWMAQAGNSLHLIGRVLGHSNQSTTAIYARFGQDQVRDALDQHANRILGASGKGNTADIVKYTKVK